MIPHQTSTAIAAIQELTAETINGFAATATRPEMRAAVAQVAETVGVLVDELNLLVRVAWEEADRFESTNPHQPIGIGLGDRTIDACADLAQLVRDMPGTVPGPEDTLTPAEYESWFDETHPPGPTVVRLADHRPDSRAPGTELLAAISGPTPDGAA